MEGDIVVSGQGPKTLHISGTAVKIDGDIHVDPDDTLVFDADVTGTVAPTGNGTVVFNGEYSPGNSPGLGVFDTDVRFGESAVVKIEIGGDNPGVTFDQLRFNRHVTFGGTLQLQLLGIYSPDFGERIEIFTYGPHDGKFDSVAGMMLDDGLMMAPDYDDGELALVVTLAGDLNLDMQVDRSDAARLLRNLGRSSDADFADGDLDGDRAVTLADLVILQANLGRTAPSSLILAALAVSVLPIRTRRFVSSNQSNPTV
jgi:hypothetical protein